MHKKTEKSILRFLIYKKFKKQFYFFACILPSYVFNESLKEFWKNSNFEYMKLISLGGAKTHFGKIALK